MISVLGVETDPASIATQFGVFGGAIIIMFYMLTRSDRREKEDKDRSENRTEHDREEMESLRRDLTEQREAHAATRVEVAALRTELTLTRERGEQCEAEHAMTKSKLHDVEIKLELLLATPPKKARSVKPNT